MIESIKSNTKSSRVEKVLQRMGSDTVLSRFVTVNLVEGLHVRPIAMIVDVVNDCGCTVLIRFGEKQVEANSQLNLMLLAAPQGSELELLADGDGAEAVLDHLENLFLTNFEVEGTTESGQVS